MPSRSFVAFDPLTLLRSLRDVDYLVVGGFAAVLYGAPTVTADLDIMPCADEDNIVRLAGVLATLHTVVREPRSSGRRIEVTADERQGPYHPGLPARRIPAWAAVTHGCPLKKARFRHAGESRRPEVIEKTGFRPSPE